MPELCREPPQLNQCVAAQQLRRLATQLAQSVPLPELRGRPPQLPQRAAAVERRRLLPQPPVSQLLPRHARWPGQPSSAGSRPRRQLLRERAWQRRPGRSHAPADSPQPGPPLALLRLLCLPAALRRTPSRGGWPVAAAQGCRERRSNRRHEHAAWKAQARCTCRVRITVQGDTPCCAGLHGCPGAGPVCRGVWVAGACKPGAGQACLPCGVARAEAAHVLRAAQAAGRHKGRRIRMPACKSGLLSLRRKHNARAVISTHAHNQALTLTAPLGNQAPDRQRSLDSHL